ncbi:putative membrane-associated zinc metalloprotease [Candidatus Ruthia magnifica str. Cm (Calyptogena magnifica)]|uniref:Zinc metalloprotease n=1 Tax=Ruthia magnifica subsp. Calyptogena magnifica TaxID=413404 RepID=A1AWJ7_RUTMC|nr:RIP metalloprotease RseP [Candidatus Ruthturnera calyptogenae]ABL02304.1 putative membrane-associated zinc metalloprotease [Candidatus Ruthia magnifica str. Cm (Calyptogena magnifica)]
MAFISSLGFFLITIGILVTVHELGHFLVAKKLNVKVLRFSIGFGKILKSFKYGETQYTLCVLPLGGFVKMLDENETLVEASEKHRAFNQQSVYKRIMIVAAGPIANFLLAVILYTVVFVIGVNGVKPIVGTLESPSIAQQSGIKIGDQLLSINGVLTPTISEFSINFIQSLDENHLYVDVISGASNLKKLEFNLSGDFLSNPEQGVDRYLGFKFAMPKLEAIIDQVVPNSPASIAGLQTNDKILSANHVYINSWYDFVNVIQNSSNKEINLQIKRNGNILNTILTPKIENGLAKAGVRVLVPTGYLNKWLVLVKKNTFDAFIAANEKVYQLTLLNLKMIKKMIMGDTSLNQISGPISIANYAGKSAQVGFTSFLSFLALISIGLGLLNLLPIPLLDGGHLFFYLIELIKGSAISQSFQQVLTKFGLFIVISLTVVALYNDLSRLL